MDAKSNYSENVSDMKQNAISDAQLSNKLNKAKERANEYQANWESVDLNDIVDQFALVQRHTKMV